MRPLAHNDNSRSTVSRQKLAHVKRLMAALADVHEIEEPLANPAASPAENLPPGWVHEAWANSPTDITAAMAFLLAATGADERPILWITLRHLSAEHGLPYGPGLKAAGIDPDRLILTCCRDEKEAQWAMEEGLKTTSLAAVVGEVIHMDLTASRRLTLAARDHKSRCLLLVRSEQAPSSAAYSRWQLTPDASDADHFDPKAPGMSRLQAALVKHRGGMPPKTRTLEWPHAPNPRALPADVADRAAPAQQPRQRHAG